MLIKEYRIPMPLTVEEYRIAQLYMINKKSREESEGEGSGIEIRKNEPYTSGPNGTNGQYTEKTYHVANHIPPWMKRFMSQATLDNLAVNEVAWNAYPYAKTIQKVSVLDSFEIEIESHYLPDCGTTENLFHKISKNHSVELVDFVAPGVDDGSLGANDPKTFVSRKSPARCPLDPDWLEKGQKESENGKYMCSYKLVKVNFKIWGMQARVERFIHDSVVTKMLCQAHQQAWCWMDEWADLNMEDIRKEEKITMRKLYELYHGKGSMPGDVSDSEDEIEAPPAYPESPKSKKSPKSGMVRSKSASLNELDENSSVDCFDDAKPFDEDYTSFNDDDFHSAVEEFSENELANDSFDEDFTLDTAALSLTCPAHILKSNLTASNSQKSILKQNPVKTRRQSSCVETRQRPITSDFSINDVDLSPINKINQLNAFPSNSSNIHQPTTFQSSSYQPQPTIYQPANIAHRKTAIDRETRKNHQSNPQNQKTGLDKYLILVLLTETSSSNEEFVDFKRKCFQFFPDMAKCYTQIRLVPVPFEFNDEETSLYDDITWMNDFRFLNKNFALTISMTQKLQYKKLLKRFSDICNEVFYEVTKDDTDEWKTIIIADDYSGIVAFDTIQGNSGDAKQQNSPGPSDSPGDFSMTVPNNFETPKNSKLERNSSENEATSSMSFNNNNSGRHNSGRGDNSGLNNSGSISGQNILVFETEKLVLLGSSLGKVLAFRRLLNPSYQFKLPTSTRIVNIFHETDPLATRLEPLFFAKEKTVKPLKMKNYHATTRNSITLNLSSSPIKRPNSKRIDIMFCPKDQFNKANFSIGLLPFYLHDALWESDEVIKFIFQSLLDVDMNGRSTDKVTVAGVRRSYLDQNIENSKFENKKFDNKKFENRKFETNNNVLKVLVNDNLPSSDDDTFQQSRKSHSLKNIVSRKSRTSISRVQNFKSKIRSRFASSSSQDEAHPSSSHQNISQKNSSDTSESLNRPTSILAIQPASSPMFIKQTSTPTPLNPYSNPYSSNPNSTSFTSNTLPSPSRLHQSMKISGNQQKWRRTKSKLITTGSNPIHRCQDLIIKDDNFKSNDEFFVGRFTYGPLGTWKLIGEVVELYLYLEDNWVFIKTCVTDQEGKVKLALNDEKLEPISHHLRKAGKIVPYKWQVSVDRSFAIAYLWTVDSKTEPDFNKSTTKSVIFSIDGAFAGSKSATGSDPKVKPGAVDLVRFWKEKHYLCVYITARPDYQKNNVEQWLTNHNFPHGPIIFCSITSEVKNFYLEPIQAKMLTLKQLSKKLIISGCYGSDKDKDIYKKIASDSMEYICIHTKFDGDTKLSSTSSENKKFSKQTSKDSGSRNVDSDSRVIQVCDYIQHMKIMERRVVRSSSNVSVTPTMQKVMTLQDSVKAERVNTLCTLTRLLNSPYGFAASWKDDTGE